MTKKVNARKSMFSLGLLRIVAQVSLFLMLLFTSSTSFALFCGGHHDVEAWAASSAHSHEEADHQDISDPEKHETDDNECQLVEKSNEVVVTNSEKVLPSTVPAYSTYSFNPTPDRFDEKKLARIRDYISEYTVFRLRGTVILNS